MLGGCIKFVNWTSFSNITLAYYHLAQDISKYEPFSKKSRLTGDVWLVLISKHNQFYMFRSFIMKSIFTELVHIFLGASWDLHPDAGFSRCVEDQLVASASFSDFGTSFYLSTRIYNKRDRFNFEISIFPTSLAINQSYLHMGYTFTNAFGIQEPVAPSIGWPLYPYFWHFSLLILFVLFRDIVYNITEFYATVIQVKGVASYKIRFSSPFST